MNPRYYQVLPPKQVDRRVKYKRPPSGATPTTYFTRPEIINNINQPGSKQPAAEARIIGNAIAILQCRGSRDGDLYSR